MNKLQVEQLATAVYAQLVALNSISIFYWDTGSPELRESLGKLKTAAQEVHRISNDMLQASVRPGHLNVGTKK